MNTEFDVNLQTKKLRKAARELVAEIREYYVKNGMLYAKASLFYAIKDVEDALDLLKIEDA